MATNNAAKRMAFYTTTDERDALQRMRLMNQSRRGRTELSVMVDGPDDGEFTVMDLRDAIEGGFGYRWEV
jgi:hypothetical protein